MSGRQGAGRASTSRSSSAAGGQGDRVGQRRASREAVRSARFPRCGTEGTENRMNCVMSRPVPSCLVPSSHVLSSQVPRQVWFRPVSSGQVLSRLVQSGRVRSSALSSLVASRQVGSRRVASCQVPCLVVSCQVTLARVMSSAESSLCRRQSRVLPAMGKHNQTIGETHNVTLHRNN